MSGEKTDKQILGAKGEDLAVRFLEEQGITILERNYHFMKNEIDIVAYNNRQIIFVEVKTRTRTDYGQPEEAVSEKKKKSMYEVAEAWLYERKMDGAPVRFDIISIVIKGNNPPIINHFEGAFWHL
jgi:putative endonuclease